MHSGVPADRCVWYCVSLQRVGRRSIHTPTSAARARRRPPSPRSSSPPPTAASDVSCARAPPRTHRTFAHSIDTSPTLCRFSAGRRAQFEKEAKKPRSLAGRRPRGGPRGRPPRDFRSRRLGPQQRLQQCAAASGARGQCVLVACARLDRPQAPRRLPPPLSGAVAWFLCRPWSFMCGVMPVQRSGGALCYRAVCQHRSTLLVIDCSRCVWINIQHEAGRYFARVHVSS